MEVVEAEVMEDLFIGSCGGGSSTVNLSPDKGRVTGEEFGVRGDGPNHIITAGKAKSLAFDRWKVDC